MARSWLRAFWVAGLVALGVVIPSARASSVIRQSPEPMLLNADLIVIGHEILVETEEIPPKARIHRRHFLVEKVLKGSGLKPGDVIVQEIVEALSGWAFGNEKNPAISEERAVAAITLKRPNTSTARYFLYPADVEKATRLADVASNPQNYLDSDDPSDVRMILAWIEARYCDYKLYFRRLDGQIEADASITPEAAVEYILRRIQFLVENPSTRAAHPEARESTRKVFRQLQDKPYFETVDLLGHFELPTAADGLLAELVRLIEDGETTEPHSKLFAVIRSIQCQRDPRAVPILIGLLHRMQPESTPGPLPPTRAKSRNEICPVITALGRLGDARAVDAIIKFLDSDTMACAADALGHIGDPRAIDPLLKDVWKSKRNSEALEGFKDPRIARAARKHLYDELEAPVLLASQGDPADRGFMHQLIRQGHAAGARWAAEAMDRTSHDLLVDALTHGEPFASQEILYALGRLRSFSTIRPLLDGEFRSIAAAVQYPATFLQGLTSHPFRINRAHGCSMGGFWDGLPGRLDVVAKREHWSKQQLQLALEVRTTCLSRFGDLYDPANSESGWVPPIDLPDMPNPLFVDAAVEYFKIHRDECIRLLRKCEYKEQHKILKAARDVGVQLLDNELAIDLLQSHSISVSSIVHKAVSKGDISLSPEEVRRWALDGRYESTKGALFHMAKKPNPDYVPIIIEVFNRGWHLYETALHHAIIANQVTQLMEPLRELTENQPANLRQKVRATLNRLGD